METDVFFIVPGSSYNWSYKESAALLFMYKKYFIEDFLSHPSHFIPLWIASQS